MTRRHWQDLPLAVVEAVEQNTGRIRSVESVATGAVSDLVVVLHTTTGTHFCKGVESDNPLGWMHRNEARLNPHLPGIAPRLRWLVDQDGWLLLGFDHVAGRHPDLAPNSMDLPSVAQTLTALSEFTPSPSVKVQRATTRWAGRLCPDVIDGDTLAHTDVTPRNFLIGPAGVVVVDWSTPCRGAAWIDTALMVVRLVRAGHPPADAQTWAEQIPAWTSARAGALDAFAGAVAELMRDRQKKSGAPHLASLAAAADCWLRYRAAL
ncbi:hypothetical protein AB0368_28595 [Actinoplanes sp. NPDC051475]|uniref:hypothetical protein n=1 Tax=Actinoplanes sp. NPDC051475 TaxID=3157225 RepID=UPI00344E3398